VEIKKIGEMGLIEKIWDIFGRKNEDEDVHFYDSGNEYILLAMDTINEGFHFERWWDPQLIGKFLVDINLSDIASKNGTPREMMVSMSFPRDLREEWVSALVNGMKSEMEKYQVDFSGGDMKESKKISLTGLVIGKVEKGKEFRRNSARVGDNVYITGKIGKNERAIYDYYKKKDGKYREILDITPRLDALNSMRKHIVTSCIDNSDGIYKSLYLISSLSSVRVKIEGDVCDMESSEEERRRIYSIGGDYELIFTSPEEIGEFQKLGVVQEGRGVVDIGAGSINTEGFNHFKSTYHK
jgi:thiamine-monophosphate kinase